jgi:hypothetical protein
MPSITDPFFMTEIELSNWMDEQEKKYNDTHTLLSHLKFIPSLWKSDNNNIFIVSKSAKKPNMLQLTCFNNNIPTYDLIRSLDNINDIVNDLITNECTIQQINYIN